MRRGGAHRCARELQRFRISSGMKLAGEISDEEIEREPIWKLSSKETHDEPVMNRLASPHKRHDDLLWACVIGVYRVPSHGDANRIRRTPADSPHYPLFDRVLGRGCCGCQTHQSSGRPYQLHVAYSAVTGSRHARMLGEPGRQSLPSGKTDIHHDGKASFQHSKSVASSSTSGGQVARHQAGNKK